MAEREPAPADRTEFERDADRIWYSGAFNRLQGVVQVASAPRRIVFHNRYTHSVKVAQLGRRLAQRLVRRTHTAYGDNAAAFLASLGGLEPDVVEAAGLGHDLGHPPYGHHGESVLNSLVTPGGFNGNAQTLRVVGRLAVRDLKPPGLNLTRATLLGHLKYPWPKSHEQGRDRTWGYYASERALIDKLRADRPYGLNPYVLTGDAPSLEASVMDWADDVTYAVHDVEDFFRAGLIPLESLKHDDVWSAIIKQGTARPGSGFATADKSDLEAAATAVTGRIGALLNWLDAPFDGSAAHEAQLTLLASELIGRYVGAAKLREPDEHDPRVLEVATEIRNEVLLLKELAWYYVINRPGLAGIQFGQAQALRELHGHLLLSLKTLQDRGGEEPPLSADQRIIPKWARGWLESGASVSEVARDMVASLDEDRVRDLTLRFTGIDPGSVMDAIL